jgi:hypothetical protein
VCLGDGVLSVHPYIPATYDTLGERSILECRQTEIANLHRAGRARYEDIVAFEITMYDWWTACVQEAQTFQYLPTPRF